MADADGYTAGMTAWVRQHRSTESTVARSQQEQKAFYVKRGTRASLGHFLASAETHDTDDTAVLAACEMSG